MADNVSLIIDFIKAWSRLDVDELVDFFAPDGVYHNMPIGPVAGHGELKAFIGNFVAAWTTTEWDILNIVSAGDVVIAERLDRTRVGETPVDLPCCGVFEMEQGKIKVWRDYFDMATYTRALGG